MVRIRETETEDVMLQLEAYRRKLLIYPVADVLVVLERWPDEHEFWPVWTELKKAMDERVSFSTSVAESHRIGRQTRPPDHRGPVQRAEIEAGLARLRNPNERFAARAELIKLGEAMLERLGE
ncbi:MAG: hypothetical protein AB7O44_32375 [Hyphomicrobiaceae bacterium]